MTASGPANPAERPIAFSTSVQAKREARTAARARRAAVDPTDRSLAPAIMALLKDRPAGVLAGYAPIGDECDPYPAMTAMIAQGWRTALPCVVGNAPLIFRRWAPGDPLEPGARRTRQPNEDAVEETPDALLVPLLAFDRTGGRLGWGGGYYDRTLSALRAAGRPIAIGVAWSEQEAPATPREAHDERLDAIATERGAIHCLHAGGRRR